MKNQQDGEGVSPVIGVILMVAITVVLAAVIGTTVLGIGGEVQQEVQAGVNSEVDQTDGNITVSITTLGNADYLRIIGSDSFNDVDDITIAPGGPFENIYLNKTGQSLTFTAPDSSSISGRLTIVAVRGDICTSGSPPGCEDDGVASPVDYPINDGDDAVPDSATETTVQVTEYEDLRSR